MIHFISISLDLVWLALWFLGDQQKPRTRGDTVDQFGFNVQGVQVCVLSCTFLLIVGLRSMFEIIFSENFMTTESQYCMRPN